MVLDVRRTVIPFVVRALRHGEGRAHRPTHEPVPVGAWRDYFQEDFDELGEVFGEGVVYALCYHARGWELRDVLIGDQPWAARSARARLWDACEDLSLDFSDSALRLCESLHNIVVKPGAMDAEMERIREGAAATAISLGYEAHGDSLLLYWMLSGLWRELGPSNRVRGTRPHVGKLTSATVASHPLLLLRFGPDIGLAARVAPEPIDGLIAGQLRGPLPWLLGHALSHWKLLESTIWERPAPAFVAARRLQGELVRTWARAIGRSGWYHLAVPLVETFRWLLAAADRPLRAPAVGEDGAPEDAPSGAAGAVAKVDLAYRDERQEARFEVRAAWADALGALEALGEVHREAIGVHPADREANHQWFVDWWAKHEVSQVVEDVGALARRIEGRLG